MHRTPIQLLTCLLLLLALAAPAAAAPDGRAAGAPADDGGAERAGGAPGYAVVGGQPARPGAWPSVVALVKAEEPDDVAGQLCGGTAVAPDLVLTAAHCFYDSTGALRRAPDQVRVIAGRTDLAAGGGVERTGVALLVHPSYDARRRRSDVVLLRVDGDLGVPAQLLVDPGGDPFEGDAAAVLGWGRTGGSDDAASRRTSALHEAGVPVVGEGRCAAAYAGAVDPAVHLCAGGGGTEEAPAPDTCNGDSGGPLLVRRPDGAAVQVGITSFGPTPCGVGAPGVFVRVSAVRDFIDAAIAGSVPPAVGPGQPAPARDSAPVARMAAGGPTEPIAQAVAASQAVFADGRAELAVLGRADGFADALAGSALGYGRGPVLFTPSSGPLHPATAAELQRALQPGSTVYLLGGTAAVPEQVEDDLRGLGLVPVRLSGSSREETAAAVAAEVVRRHGRGAVPFGTAVLVTGQSWPDAVVAGQLGAWWGFPILLAGGDQLHPATADALASAGIGRLLIVGGHGAVGSAVEEAVRGLRPDVEVTRLAGGSRMATAAAVAGWHLAELAHRGLRPPDAVVAANLRRDDAYAHVLSATPLLGRTAGLLLPVEGDAGDVIPDDVRAAFCGVGGRPHVAGGADVVADAVAHALPGILDGTAC